MLLMAAASCYIIMALSGGGGCGDGGGGSSLSFTIRAVQCSIDERLGIPGPNTKTDLAFSVFVDGGVITPNITCLHCGFWAPFKPSQCQAEGEERQESAPAQRYMEARPCTGRTGQPRVGNGREGGSVDGREGLREEGR